MYVCLSLPIRIAHFFGISMRRFCDDISFYAEMLLFLVNKTKRTLIRLLLFSPGRLRSEWLLHLYSLVLVSTRCSAHSCSLATLSEHSLPQSFSLVQLGGRSFNVINQRHRRWVTMDRMENLHWITYSSLSVWTSAEGSMFRAKSLEVLSLLIGVLPEGLRGVRTSLGWSHMQLRQRCTCHQCFLPKSLGNRISWLMLIIDAPKRRVISPLWFKQEIITCRLPRLSKFTQVN